jgi:hypothetical protein
VYEVVSLAQYRFGLTQVLLDGGPRFAPILLVSRPGRVQ